MPAMKLLLIFLLSTTALFGQTPQELDRIVRKLAPDLIEATVAIMLDGGSGSGVIVSPEGLVITAAHVTSEPGKPMKVLLSDGRELDATSLGVDHGTDGALLQINAPGPFPYRPYVETRTYKVGDWAIATGHPGGPVIGRPAPLRLGRISEAGTKSGFADAITTDATVISGDSGGPLYNLKGEVIGINSNISGSWRVNKHVPLPAIVAKWDALLDGELFGRPKQPQQTVGDLFNEPYAALRERFEKALREHSEDPEAAALLKRPRLLDPHHMQAFLDRWEPDPNAPREPQYGLRLDPRTTRITGLVPGSPAAQSDLQVGDVITAVNGRPVWSATDLALELRQGGSASLTVNEEKSVSLEPTEVIARRHFPQPVAGVIDMIVIESEGADEGPERLPAGEFLAELDDLREKLEASIIPLQDVRGRTVTHGTVIYEGGQLLAKASEIENLGELTAKVGDQDFPVEMMGSDEETDLALLRVRAPGLVPVKWEDREPKVGQLVLTPGEPLLTGVITQPARIAPKFGFELNHTTGEPNAYLGVTFSAGEDPPTIETVELKSPADRVGLLEGDQIIAFEESPIDSFETLREMMGKRSPGEKVALRVKRGDKEITLRPILDERPIGSAGSFSRAASQRDGRLSNLSARGGDLSERRTGFPKALYHDQLLSPRRVGTPLVNLEGKVLGINIARSMRHRSLAIPTLEVVRVVDMLRKQARN